MVEIQHQIEKLKTRVKKAEVRKSNTGEHNPEILDTNNGSERDLAEYAQWSQNTIDKGSIVKTR